MPQKLRLKVVIVGAGLGGLAAAIAIKNAGHDVLILEQAPALGEVGAGIQIPPNSSRILCSWGLREEFDRVSVYPAAFRFRGYQDGRLLSEYSLIPGIEETYGAPYWHIHRADFHRILVGKAMSVGIEIQLDSRVANIDFSTPSATLADGRIIGADLIIGADGLKSRCRELLLGHDDPPQLTGDLAYRILIPGAKMKADPELCALTEQPAINFWMGPDAHAVCYLLKGGELYNIVLLCPDNLPPGVNIAPAEPQEIKDFFKNWDPKLQKIISLMQGCSKWRLQNSREMPFWTHPDGKFTLLGDACHATLPYLAQGAAMAVEDGCMLGRLLEKVGSLDQILPVLRIYENLRKPRTTRLVEGGTAQRNILHAHDGAAQEERDRVLLQDATTVGHPNRWKDPEFRDFMFGYDAYQQADIAWQLWQERGSVPSRQEIVQAGSRL